MTLPHPKPTTIGRLCGLALAALGAGAAAQSGPQPKLDTVTLGAGMYRIHAEVARTEEQREMGLMLRKQMGTYEGMLFVFEDTALHCFWMKNTLLPLSIAFIADDGTIVNIADMAPQTTDSHCPAKAVHFALEMNQGWFDKRALRAGSKLEGAPFRPQ
jgi:uncharacterized membrane protein (UPF0127 family)